MVHVRITSAEYPTAWEGPLSQAPVTRLVPEGIVSARTTSEAHELRVSLGSLLSRYERVVVTGAHWQIKVERIHAEEEL